MKNVIGIHHFPTLSTVKWSYIKPKWLQRFSVADKCLLY